MQHQLHGNSQPKDLFLFHVDFYTTSIHKKGHYLLLQITDFPAKHGMAWCRFQRLQAAEMALFVFIRAPHHPHHNIYI